MMRPSASWITSEQNRAPSLPAVLSASLSSAPGSRVSLSLPSTLAPPRTGDGRSQEIWSLAPAGPKFSTRVWSFTATKPNSATMENSTFSVPSRALK